ncbi:MAG: hypothetical protein ACON47_04850 [Flavobacteriaceae bacterium]
MKYSYLPLFILFLFVSCSTEEEPEVIPEPEPTTFLEKYDNTIWDNSTDKRLGFSNDTSRFLVQVPLVGDCIFFSDNTSFEADDGVYSINIETNIPSEFIWTLTFTRGENYSRNTYIITESNDVLTVETITSRNDETLGEESIDYKLLLGTLDSYCN